MPREPVPATEMIVRYSAQEMPINALEGLQHDVMTSYNRRERTAVETLKLVNLLLTIALQKLSAA
jgi:hypothetical protein